MNIERILILFLGILFVCGPTWGGLKEELEQKYPGIEFDASKTGEEICKDLGEKTAVCTSESRYFMYKYEPETRREAIYFPSELQNNESLLNLDEKIGNLANQVNKTEVRKLVEDYDTSRLSQLKADIDELSKQIDKLKNERDKFESDYSASGIASWNNWNDKYNEKMARWKALQDIYNLEVLKQNKRNLEGDIAHELEHKRIGKTYSGTVSRTILNEGSALWVGEEKGAEVNQNSARGLVLRRFKEGCEKNGLTREDALNKAHELMTKGVEIGGEIVKLDKGKEFADSTTSDIEDFFDAFEALLKGKNPNDSAATNSMQSGDFSGRTLTPTKTDTKAGNESKENVSRAGNEDENSNADLMPLDTPVENQKPIYSSAGNASGQSSGSGQSANGSSRTVKGKPTFNLTPEITTPGKWGRLNGK